MTDATPCGIIVKNLGLDDAHGYRLPEAHTGPHEFVTSRGEVTQWETDFNCLCEHCQACVSTARPVRATTASATQKGVADVEG